jgi:hypothetical protein
MHGGEIVRGQQRQADAQEGDDDQVAHRRQALGQPVMRAGVAGAQPAHATDRSSVTHGTSENSGKGVPALSAAARSPRTEP